MRSTSGSKVWARILGVIFFLCGLYLVIGGGWLLSYGDTPYYLISGIVLLITSWLIFKQKAAAFWLHGLLIIGTLLWSFYEVGYDFWSLVPRLDVVGLLGILLWLPFVANGVARSAGAKSVLGIGVVLGLLTLAITFFLDPSDQNGNLPTDQIAQNGDPTTQPASDWRAYGRSEFGDRYSPLDQINSSNVKNLKVAWTMQTHDLKRPNDPGETTNEATPLAVNGTLYFCSTHQKLFAVNGQTGQTKWVFDPHIYDNAGFQHLTCRGVTYFQTPAQNAVTSSGAQAPQQCKARIFLPTNDGQLYAIDAESGQRCSDFGNNGQIDLKDEGMPYKQIGDYEPTSPPVVTNNLVIIAGAVTDNGSIKEPSGVIRAFDAYTGKLVWSFDTGNPDPNEPPGPNHHYVANSPNSWITNSYDSKLGLIYIPTGVQTPDEWGGGRDANAERYASGILALHADTGKLAWFYQTVHHDLWDMDLPSQISLVDLKQKDGSSIPALYAPAKTGNLFVLDRRNGHRIVDAPELPVPTQDVAPGDHVSPTQPFSKLTFRPSKLLTGADMWGGSTLDQLACRIYFHTLNYKGTFTPPSERGTLVYPGNLGVFEWGGISVDPRRQIAIANPEFLPFVSQLVPRGKDNPLWPPKGAQGAGGETGLQPNYGARFGVKISGFMDPLLTGLGFNVPCKRPPWGEVAGIDLRTQKIVWRHRNGTLRDSLASSPLPIQLPPFKVGMPGIGGSIVTAGNVSFLAATNDNYIRAFDVTNGKLLWQARLPAGGQATPMTYSVDGKQYVVIYAGGHGSFGTKLGDYLIAYALPSQADNSGNNQ